MPLSAHMRERHRNLVASSKIDIEQFRVQGSRFRVQGSGFKVQLIAGFSFLGLHTSTTEPRMTKISRFARNDDMGKATLRRVSVFT